MLKKIKSNVRSWMLNNKEESLGGKKIKQLDMCKKCYTFYYKHSWHFDKPSYLNSNEEIEVPVRFMECTACLEQENSLHEIESNLVWRMGR